MGRGAYYSPLLLGILLVLLLNESVRDPVSTWSVSAQWLVVAAVAVGVGVACQVLMVGAQGAFAQVLPVPGGRSIRGRAAVVSGWLLIAAIVLSAVSAMLSYEEAAQNEELTTAAIVLGIVSLVALGGFLVIYVWSIPAAMPDFRARD